RHVSDAVLRAPLRRRAAGRAADRGRDRRPGADPRRRRARLRAAAGAAQDPGARDVVISIRRARRDDVEFLVELLAHEEVEPFLSARALRTADALVAELEPEDERERGLFVIEVDGERAGSMAFQRVNARSRIARAGGLAVLPAFRGRGVADEAAQLLQR